MELTVEERSSSAGRPELDLGDEPEPDDGTRREAATVAGGLCRLPAPDSREPETRS